MPACCAACAGSERTCESASAFICWCDHNVQIQVLEEVLLGLAQGYPATTTTTDTLGNHYTALLSRLVCLEQAICTYVKHTRTGAPQGLCSCLTVMQSQLTHGAHVVHVGRVCVRTDCHAMRIIPLDAHTTKNPIVAGGLQEKCCASPNPAGAVLKSPPSARDAFLQVASAPRTVLTSGSCYAL